jgi:hypothetical protein
MQSLSGSELIEAQVNATLESRLSVIQQAEETIRAQGAPTEVSPWLELTQWGRYLQGYSFGHVAPLAALPDPCHEPLLVEFTESIGRLIEQAYQSINENKINAFDQVRINSFLQRQRAWDRPLFIQLQKATYQRYKHVWQRLVCFIYRSTQPGQSVTLAHQLTPSQISFLDQMVGYGTELLARQEGPCEQRESESALGSTAISQIRALLDRVCLRFSIALLDHTLKGDLFESGLVGFLAVLGVDAEKKTFRDAYSYTSYLSAMVKMTQMLVVQEAVFQAEEGVIEHPADAIDEMRERFLIHGVRAPFGWVTRLRTYGKKIQNTTTSLGYIYWSDNHEKLTYKGLEITMDLFRRFVQVQVEQAQRSLEKLFLLHEEETREAVIPSVSLHQLKDDPTENRKGWSFLQDGQNANLLPDGQRWLLNRVLRTDWLRAEFLELREPGHHVVWKPKAVQAYLVEKDGFLELLLLCVHLTAGQPARGTEVLSLRHCNTVHGRHRSVFIENGLVSTVTAYHKGYNITGSTKIIHRYLPKEISEMVVYYLWLILPFWQKLEILAFGKKEPPSPFLWPKGSESWESGRLSAVLEREARQHLQTKMNITYYRHAAIAMSRVHLKCGGFKRDYGVEETQVNQQGSHSSWLAGTVYARGLKEAPGHVEIRRAQYRAISREWHGFLGFQVHLGPRKRPLAEITNTQSSTNRPSKRR